jgi:hypothetical protein
MPKQSMFVLMVWLFFAVTLNAQDLATGNPAEAIASPIIAADKAASVDRTFYTGALSWHWQPSGLATSITGSGYGMTTNGGTISSVTACLYNESSFGRRFQATAAVVRGSSTIQAITFATDFPPLQTYCHQLGGFNAALQPGEFQVSVTFDEFEADNIFAGIPTTDSGQTFDIAIGSQRPPSASGPQGPIVMKGIGIGYRITENDAPPPPPPSCIPDADTLCLNNGRFKVEANYRTSTTTGTAQTVKLTDETGYLWFFSATNVELAVKILNACALNNRYWIFAAGLTDQSVDITVTDTLQPAITKHYSNPLGRTFVTITDTDGLASCP